MSCFVLASCGSYGDMFVSALTDQSDNKSGDHTMDTNFFVFCLLFAFSLPSFG
jgi:hypothetical protein